jgi:hypothetical protein
MTSLTSLKQVSQDAQGSLDCLEDFHCDLDHDVGVVVAHCLVPVPYNFVSIVSIRTNFEAKKQVPFDDYRLSEQFCV